MSQRQEVDYETLKQEILEEVIRELSRELPKVIKEAVKEALAEQFGRREVTISDFERVYDFVRDSFGMASIKDIRVQLGLTLEEFMSRFRDYILANYELISGGKEGFVKGGILYGIIRKKGRNWPYKTF